ncbi:hypothetical protein CSB45_08165 [candidate division KSB3 bacterium]|uniref:Uncharacterized protein n=1 Tax=candidate division KSB3 bacterium TaxID=2044937 RepID=A0A2G6E542_9BACT|nr:MAG: hypothetical protein CSB45_08165 [candidate division KSB3 bacterium]PIE29806.1 MAG: hypothetical protein CSA57_07050 [candidate division KSB3 bacterium]
MKALLFQRRWNWRVSGVALGIVFLLAVTLVKPIGVSTQFVIFDGILWNMFSGDIVVKNPDSEGSYSSPNAYFNKSGGKYAKSVANPLNYSFIFVAAMILGGFLAGKLQSEKKTEDSSTIPSVWRERFGGSAVKRHAAAFSGGLLVLTGARLAGGCTSGHMMSGVMQTSLSGYLFMLGTFLVAVPVARFMYTKEGK